MEDKQPKKPISDFRLKIETTLAFLLITSPFIIAAIVFLVIFCQSCAAPDPHDGRCDICGKYATHHGTKEEFCDEHAWDAALYYFEQGMNE